MCSVCLCVMRQCHCVPTGQQIPPDHSSEWDLIPLGLFMSLPSFQRQQDDNVDLARWQTKPSELLLSYPPTTYHHCDTHSEILPPKHYLPQQQRVPTSHGFTITKTLPMLLLCYIPKLWLSSPKTPMSPSCQYNLPHFTGTPLYLSPFV